jgi:V/A-type H+-transporting ATPase subunit I
MFTHTVNMFIIGRAKEAVFDPNGISGFGLYFTFLWVAVYFFMTGKFLYFLIYPAGVFVFMILLKEIIFGEGSFLMRFIQGFFELFEVLISYLTNTLSFIRLGAFALNHAGLFMAFYMMSQMTQNKGLSFLILVLGNILIIVLEGVIVFIQALRLQMYEYFSRFYNGNGRFFNPDRYKL